MNNIFKGVKIVIAGAAFILAAGISHAETEGNIMEGDQLSVERFMDALMGPCIDADKFIDVLMDPEQKTAQADMNFVIKNCQVESQS